MDVDARTGGVDRRGRCRHGSRGNPDLDLSCFVSSDAYPSLVAATRPATGLTLAACSGCAPDPWVVGRRGTSLFDAYHPSAVGHRDGFAPLVAQALG